MRPPKLQVEQTINMGPPSFFWFLLISLSLTGTGSLRVEMGESPVKSLRNKEAIIPCTISDWGPGDMNLPKLSVQWTQRLLNGSDEVYLYVSGTHTRTRPGSYISDSEIIRGNVALHLPRVQFTDEGEYTCTVFYTPNKVVGKSALQVSAPPTASLTPTDITIESGMEKTVVCEATGFYPEDIRFEWVKHLSDSRNVVLKKEVSYSHPIENEDETYNQISFLRINPTLEDNGNIYSCNVSHRSMETDLHFNLTLSVTEPNNKEFIIYRALIGVFIAVLLVLCCVIIHMMFYKKVAPKLSAIKGAEPLVHMNRATLSCLISGFRPKPIRITLWLKRNGGEEMEIDSWDSETQTGSSAPVSHHREEQRVVIVPEREGLMRNGNGTNLPPAQRPLRVEMFPIITSKLLLSNCQCTIHITPDIEEDDGAELTVRVTHSALRLPISVSCRLKVRGVKPKLAKIVSPLHILHGEPLTLTCPIYGFKPKPLSVTWLKVDPRGRETELLSWDRGTTNINDPNYSHELAEDEREEGEEEDDMNYFLSNLILTPTVREDHGAQYVCRTHHYATKQKAEKRMEMQVLVSEPRVSAIKCDPEVPGCNQTTTLSCTIEKFYPKDLKIRWYQGLEVIKSEGDPEGAKEDPESGLFSRTTEIEITPTFNDHGKEFHMEIIHNMKIYKKAFCLELKGFPQAKEIICSNLSPKYGEPLTLSCEVSECNGRDVTAEWQMGNDPITRGTRTETPTNGDSVSFLLTLTPTAEHYGKLLTCLIKHKDLPQLIKKNISLKLPDVAPTLSEIMVSQKVLQINRETSFTVTISSFSQKNLKVKWYRSFMPLTANIVTTEPQIGGDRLYCCTSTLRYTPTKSNIGMSIRCEVTANKETREKRFQFTLASEDELDGRNQPEPISEVEMDGRNEPEPTPDRGGQEITDIECVTPNPRKGQSLTLQCKIKGQDVEHGDFSWSDGLFPIDESLIDNSNLNDGSGCISKVTFTPDEDDGEIRFEATFNFVTTERTYQLPWV